MADHTRHHRHDEIVTLLRAGHTATEIAKQLHVERQTVGRIRRDLDIPLPARIKYPTVQAAFEAKAQRVADGHMEWTGSRQTPSGTPVLRHREQMHTAARVAFTIRTGRDPEGYVVAECDMQHCVAPEHVEDEPGRQRLREQARYLTGGGGRPANCPAGHDQAEYGRWQRDGRPYCTRCKTDRRAARIGATA